MSKSPDNSDDLRAIAEQLLGSETSAKTPVQSVDELQHELEVHRIELEMQNEHLRQSYQELEESRDRYVNFFDFAPVGYLTLNRDGMIDEINLTAAALLGAERSKLLHFRFAPLVVAENRDDWYRHFLRVLKSDKTLICETILQRGDGSRFFARLDCLSDRKNGATTGVHIVLIDVSLSKQTEEELRVAAIAFEAQEGMMVTDANCEILRVNKAFTAITGYTTEEVVGRNPHLLSSGRHEEAYYASMWEEINRRGCWEGEIWDKRKNGEVYPEHLIVTAVKNPAGVVTNYVATLTDITMSRHAADEIQHLAFYDTLTRLPNRRLLLDRLKLALFGSARSGREGAILFLDLDNFKTLNDTLGHDIGDLLLQQVALRLESCVREGDTVARMGGDEFVVMLEDLHEQDMEAAAQTEAVGNKILAELNEPYRLAGKEYRNTVSIGATLFRNQQSGVDEIFKQADIAMYQAKKAGRNALRFFDPEMQARINARAALESELRAAIDARQFRLYYQIQVDSSRRVLGAEALIRWLHPERGLVPPAEFIHLAEETGLILPIGEWVLETACAQLAVWQAHVCTRELTLSVNVSASQFHEAGFVEQVRAAVTRHAVNPMLLKLEPTESILLENIDDTVSTMNALKVIGVHFSLDDFGTGYSSLQYLKMLPLNQLKIDQSFVRDLEIDSNDQAIVRTIIVMAHSLDLDVIAEGVETEEQRQILLNQGCHRYQGYLFGKPVPIEEFETQLR